MADMTVTSVEDMDPIYDGVARRERAIGVTLRMQMITLPAKQEIDRHPLEAC